MQLCIEVSLSRPFDLIWLLLSEVKYLFENMSLANLYTLYISFFLKIFLKWNADKLFRNKITK